jgi:hypothetical protein
VLERLHGHSCSRLQHTFCLRSVPHPLHGAFVISVCIRKLTFVAVLLRLNRPGARFQVHELEARAAAAEALSRGFAVEARHAQALVRTPAHGTALWVLVRVIDKCVKT